MKTDQEILQACQTHLQALQPVKTVEVKYRTVRRDRPELTVDLVLKTEVGQRVYFYEIKRGLSVPRLEHSLLQLKRDSRQAKAHPLLLADYVPPRLADRLVEAGVDFVDAAGNICIHWAGKLYIRIQGHKPKQLHEATFGRLVQSSGLQVIFVLLADPTAVSRSYRDLAKTSGVALGSVARIARELREKGYLQQKGRKQWVLTQKQKLLDLWLSGYGDTLRPKLFVGRFQPPGQDLGETLAKFRKEAEAKGITWALTGGFAADLLTRHFRGNQLGLFVSEWSSELARNLRWLPSPPGPVTVLRQFSPLVVFTPKRPVEGAVAHPLLVYGELFFQGRERELESAKLIFEQYIVPIIHEA